MRQKEPEMTTIQHTKNADAPRRVLYELLLVMAISVLLPLLVPGTELIAILVPVAYLLIEGRLRHQPIVTLGFNWRGIPAGLVATWPFILLVSVGIQVAVPLLGAALWPDLLTHILARLPQVPAGQISILFLLLILSTLGEGVVYRGFFQQRLGLFTGTTIAILLSSLVFGFAHWSQGNLALAAVDVGLVVVDSILYGLIFARSHNLYVAWLAHLLADWVGLMMLLLM